MSEVVEFVFPLPQEEVPYLMKVVIRRQWNDWRQAAVPFESIDGFHLDDASGGVAAKAPRQFIHAYVWCDELGDQEFSHSCQHGRGPHRIKVCIVKSANDPKVIARISRLLEEQETKPRENTVHCKERKQNGSPCKGQALYCEHGKRVFNDRPAIDGCVEAVACDAHKRGGPGDPERDAAAFELAQEEAERERPKSERVKTRLANSLKRDPTTSEQELFQAAQKAFHGRSAEKNARDLVIRVIHEAEHRGHYS